MDNQMPVLNDPKLMLVFAYAPAGLGHLRVTDALYHGLPENSSPLLLGTQDKTISFIHRFISINLYTRMLMELAQTGISETMFTFVYRRFLRTHTKLLYQQLITLIDNRYEPPNTILLIATHFGLAHQLAAIKEKLAREKNVKILLVVQVTDDSPLKIWYVDGADLIVVPSEKTKDTLLEYGKAKQYHPIPIQVLSYPISPLLSHEKENQEKNRKEQLTIHSQTHIHVAIPISGAAVGTQYFSTLIDALYHQSNRFVFHIISKYASYTKPFLESQLTRPYVNISASATDKETIDAYEDIYKNNTISLEITKPSEQAFKALLHTNQTGGSLLLFAQPVGKHEYDNLDFLRRHHLIPSLSVRNELFDYAKKNKELSPEEKESLLQKASQWRGVELPTDPLAAASFIMYALRMQIFETMVKRITHGEKDDKHIHEIQPNGVKLFWEYVSSFLKSQQLTNS